MVHCSQSPVADFLWLAMTYTFDATDWWQWEDLNVPEFAYTTRPHPERDQHLIVEITDPTYNALLYHSDIEWLEPLWIH